MAWHSISFSYSQYCIIPLHCITLHVDDSMNRNRKGTKVILFSSVYSFEHKFFCRCIQTEGKGLYIIFKWVILSSFHPFFDQTLSLFLRKQLLMNKSSQSYTKVSNSSKSRTENNRTLNGEESKPNRKERRIKWLEVRQRQMIVTGANDVCFLHHPFLSSINIFVVSSEVKCRCS